MKKTFKFLLVFLLFFCIRINAEGVPSVTSYTVKSGDNVLEEVNGFYHSNTREVNLSFSFDSYDENYCFVYGNIQMGDAATIVCNYNEPVSASLSSEFGAYKINYGFITKQYAEANSGGEGSFDTDEIINMQNIFIENDYSVKANKIFLSPENITDSNGNVITKVNGNYYFSEDQTYYLNYVIYNDDYHLTNINYEIFSVSVLDDKNNSNSGTAQVTNNKISVPFKLDSSTPLTYTYMELKTYFSAEIGSETRDLDSVFGDVYVINASKEYVETQIVYKNSTEEVKKNSLGAYELSGQYYNEENPLVLKIKPKNFTNDSIAGKVSFVKRYEDCDEECEFVYTTNYEMNVTLTDGQVNQIEIDNYIPSLPVGDSLDEYFIRVKAGSYEALYPYTYNQGRLSSFTYIDPIPYTINYRKGDNFLNIYRYFGYDIRGFDGKKVYTLFTGRDFDNNKEYKVVVSVNQGNTISYEKYLDGSGLNNYYFFVPVGKNTEDEAEFKVYYNDNLIVEEKVTSQRESLETSDLLYISDSNIISKTFEFPGYYFIKEGNNSFKLDFAPGNNYDASKTYHYAIRTYGTTGIFKTGTVSGTELNNGTSFELSGNIPSKSNLNSIELSILDDNNYMKDKFYDTTLNIEAVSSSKYTELKKDVVFDLSTSTLNSLKNKVGNDVLFVDKNGQNPTKKVSYTVEYYKDNELALTETVNETIDFFEEAAAIDSNKVNMVDKFTGYKFKTTSKTDYDEETGEYYLKDIKDGDTLKVYYERSEFGYTIEYYYNNEKDDSLTITGKALYGEKISDYENKLKDGYSFVKTENLPVTISETEANNIIKVYYEKKVVYTVTFDTNGGSSIPNQLVDDGNNFTEPSKPTRDGYKFAGWYSDSGLINEYNFGTSVKSNITIYAKWKQILLSAGATIAEPVEGANPSYSITSKEPDKYSVEVDYWYLFDKEAGFPHLDSNSVFEAGKKYQVRFIFTAKDGYALDSNTVLTLNDIETKKYAPAAYGQYTFTVVETKLETPTATISKGNNNSLVITVPAQSAATGYQVYRSTNNKKWSNAINVTSNVFTDTGLTYGTTYYYKVKACNPEMCTSFSNTVSLTAKPNKVENLRVSSIGQKSIKIAWDKVSVTGYEVYMNGKRVKTITKNGTLSYNKKSLKANKTYSFKVRAYKTVKGKKKYGAFSETIYVRTAPATPKKPGISLNDYNALNLNVKGVGGAVKYEIVRSSTKKGTYEIVGEITSAGIYIDGNLNTGWTYYYKVRACNSDNTCSPYTSIVSKRVVPRTPGISAWSPETKKVIITTTQVNSAEGYEIYRSTRKSSGYKKVGDITDLENLTFENATSKGKTYYYKVRTYTTFNGVRVYSAYSSIKKIRSK